MQSRLKRLFVVSLLLLTGCKTTQSSSVFDASAGSAVSLLVVSDRPTLSVVEWHYVLKARSQRPACFDADPATRGADAARLFVELVKPTGPASEGFLLRPTKNLSASYCQAQLDPSNELRLRYEDPTAPQGFRTGIVRIFPKGMNRENRLLCWPHAKDPNRLTCDDAEIALPDDAETAVPLHIGIK